MKKLEQSKNKMLKRVPALRFPPFREGKEWRENTIYDLFNTLKKSEKVIDFDKEKVITVKLHTNGVVKNERNGTLTGGANYFIRHAGQFVFSKIDLLNGAFGLIPEELDGFCTSSDVPAFFFKQEESALFFINWLKANYRKIKIERTGTSSTLKRISVDNFLSMPILLPTPQEQQKIADCLSSLDNVISLQTQKIDAIQQYKKGLMQKLFPAEGETVPELRFGGFQNAEAWHSLNLGSCLLKRPEYGVNAPAVPFSKELPTYLRITDIAENGSFIHEQKTSVAKSVTDSNYLRKGDVVLARTGASVGKSYLYNENDGALVFAGFLIRVRPDQKKLNSGFLFQYFKTEQYWKWVSLNSARSGQPGINGSEYSALPIVLPSMQEQQKIADCLSSLDELIVTETQKLGTLKKHKTGLMQQLFPAMDEVNA